jgi:hypothetical protein
MLCFSDLAAISVAPVCWLRKPFNFMLCPQWGLTDALLPGEPFLGEQLCRESSRPWLSCGDAGDAIESSAAIAGDLVFIVAATGELVALNLSDGKKRGTYKTTKPIGESSPAVANGLVFIEAQRSQASGVLAARRLSPHRFLTQAR